MSKALIKLNQIDKNFTIVDDLLKNEFQLILKEEYSDIANNYTHLLENECLFTDYKDGIFNKFQLDKITSILGDNLLIRVYYGCRVEDSNSYKENGLLFSSKKQYLNTEDECSFSSNICDMLKNGGVYVAFGSEFQLKEVNKISKDANKILFDKSIPSILVFDIPLKNFSIYSIIYQNLINLWCNKTLGISEYKYNSFDGELRIKNEVSFEYFKFSLHPKKICVKNDFNGGVQNKIYLWDEISPKVKLKNIRDILRWDAKIFDIDYEFNDEEFGETILKIKKRVFK